MSDSNTRDQAGREQTLDAIIDIVGANGWRSATPSAVAGRAGISTAEFDREFPTRAAWVTAAYERLYERRLEQYRKAAKRIPAGNTDPEVTLKAVMTTFLDGDQSDPLFAASYDLLFFSRNDPRLLRRVQKIRATWTKKIDALLPGMFPRGTSKKARDIFMTHAEYIGTVPLSNSFAVWDMRPEDYPIMKSLIAP